MRIIVRKPNGDPVARLIVEAACDADRRLRVPWLGTLVIHRLDGIDNSKKAPARNSS